MPSLLPAAVARCRRRTARGEQVRVGDAVLTDGGLYPGRVVQLAPGPDGHLACVFKDARGQRRTATSTQVHDGMLFVGRSPADHLPRCIAWLEQRIRQPPRGRADPERARRARRTPASRSAA